jgi:hypothetical protein
MEEEYKPNIIHSIFSNNNIKLQRTQIQFISKRFDPLFNLTKLPKLIIKQTQLNQEYNKLEEENKDKSKQVHSEVLNQAEQFKKAQE